MSSILQFLRRQRAVWAVSAGLLTQGVCAAEDAPAPAGSEADVQRIEHPAYKRDRGPVTVWGLRAHAEF